MSGYVLESWSLAGELLDLYGSLLYCAHVYFFFYQNSCLNIVCDLVHYHHFLHTSAFFKRLPSEFMQQISGSYFTARTCNNPSCWFCNFWHFSRRPFCRYSKQMNNNQSEIVRLQYKFDLMTGWVRDHELVTKHPCTVMRVIQIKLELFSNLALKIATTLKQWHSSRPKNIDHGLDETYWTFEISFVSHHNLKPNSWEACEKNLLALTTLLARLIRS